MAIVAGSRIPETEAMKRCPHGLVALTCTPCKLALFRRYGVKPGKSVVRSIRDDEYDEEELVPDKEPPPVEGEEEQTPKEELPFREPVEAAFETSPQSGGSRAEAREPEEELIPAGPSENEGDGEEEEREEECKDGGKARKTAETEGASTIAGKGEPNVTPLLALSAEEMADPTLPPLLTPAEKEEKERLESLSVDMVLKIPVDRVCPYKRQPRHYFNRHQIAGLGLSMERRGQKVPCNVKWLPDDRYYYCELIDGQRRLEAAKQRGLPTLRVIRCEVKDETEQHCDSAIANFGRIGHTHLEIAESLERIQEETGATRQDLAQDFGKSVGWVQQYLSLTRLSPKVRDMMSMDLLDAKRIKFASALVLSSLPHNLQEKLAIEVLEKNIPGSMANQYIRRRAREEGLRTNPTHSPNKDWAVIFRSLKVLWERTGLLEDISPQQIAALFENRDPADRAETIRRIKELIPHIEALAAKFTADGAQN